MAGQFQAYPVLGFAALKSLLDGLHEGQSRSIGYVELGDV